MSGAPRVAAVSGAGSQLGEAVVEALLAAGWSVAAYDAVESTAELRGSRAIKLDVCDRDAVARELRAAESELGPIGGLVVLPGPTESTPIAEIAPEAWSAALRSHLLVAANFAWAVLPAMLTSGAGNIVAVASDSALGAPGNGAHAAAASGAMIGFSKALAIELAKTGVQVNAIAAELPGALAAEVAATALYLLDERHFFLGQLLSANGARR